MLTVMFIILSFLIAFDKQFMVAFIIAYSINVLPGIYLHIEYYNVNKGLECIIQDNRMILRNTESEVIYHTEDLKKISVYLPPAAYKGSNWRSFCIESYYFARIITKDNNEIIITCLLNPRFEDALKLLRNVPYERKQRIFCSYLLN